MVNRRGYGRKMPQLTHDVVFSWTLTNVACSVLFQLETPKQTVATARFSSPLLSRMNSERYQMKKKKREHCVDLFSLFTPFTAYLIFVCTHTLLIKLGNQTRRNLDASLARPTAARKSKRFFVCAQHDWNCVSCWLSYLHKHFASGKWITPKWFWGVSLSLAAFSQIRKIMRYHLPLGCRISFNAEKLTK